MKKGLFYFIPMLLIVAMIACGSEDSTSSNATTQTTNSAAKGFSIKLSAVEFNEKMAGLSNATIVDVRTPGELQETGKIKNAVAVDFYGDGFEAAMDKFKKDEPIMVYCKSGGRSGKTAKLLKKKGFTQIYDLKGGMSGWLKNKFEVEKVEVAK
ncbi:MAG: rhodanese-like domain-containing protein [Chitinophagales bacterium]